MFPDFYSKQLRLKLADGKIMDQALSELRSEGASILQCIVAVQKAKRCSLADAKELVHFSPTWADMREANEKFQEELEEIARRSDEPRAQQNGGPPERPGNSGVDGGPPSVS